MPSRDISSGAFIGERCGHVQCVDSVGLKKKKGQEKKAGDAKNPTDMTS